MDAGSETENPGRQVLDMMVMNLIFSILSLRILEFFHVEQSFRCLEIWIENVEESWGGYMWGSRE